MAGAQPAYPQNYFRWPLDLEPEIVANMGELRPNHWHMGLDMRTNQRENQQVFAAAEGYIAYIGIRAQSFGRFIIINHPNGYSTLYGHLNDFAPAIEEYVTAHQYANKSWATELTLTPDKFPVTKGAFIAYSGNTGGSQGPHVHFEIRETSTGKCLNPLLFGFPLPDNVRPSLLKLAMYDRTRSIYATAPRVLTLKNTDSGYIIPKMPVVITALPKFSFAIQAFDRITGSNNQDGIYSADLFIDDQLFSRFVIDSIGYDETAYMNAHIDYKTRAAGGSFYQHLSRMPGDRSAVYKNAINDGVIELNDTLLHTVRIEVRDAAQNISTLSFLLRKDTTVSQAVHFSGPKLIPRQTNRISRTDFEMELTERAIYDTVNLAYSSSGTPTGNAITSLHLVNNTDIPVHDNLLVSLRLKNQLTNAQRDKIIIQRTSKRGRTNRRAEFNGGRASAEFGDFGIFQAFLDETGPSVNNLGRGDTVDLSPASRIVFTPTDNFGIRDFSAELDGQWLRFTNDKSRSWIYVFDERCPYGVHELKVTVNDIAGNTLTRSWWFKKYPYTPPPPKKKKVSSKKKKTPTKKKPVKKSSRRKK